jgi:hypothetical protein
MLGGNRVAADAAMPLLRAMGSHIIYCGEHGAGLAAKMCSLLVVASSMAAVSEALAAGRRLGLEPKVLTQVGWLRKCCPCSYAPLKAPFIGSGALCDVVERRHYDDVHKPWLSGCW